MKGKILVAEDNEQNLYLVTFILKHNQYEVVSVTDGVQAVEKAKTEKPILILMDMQLSKMSGYEATRKIKEIKELKNIPIIALTAFAMKGDEGKTLEAGCDGYLEKPIDPETFMEEVDKFLPH
jgi:two-component system, cell cycle response regulator DivK